VAGGGLMALGSLLTWVAASPGALPSVAVGGVDTVQGKLTLALGVAAIALGALRTSSRALAFGGAFVWACSAVGVLAIILATMAAASSEDLVVNRAVELESRRSGQPPGQVRPHVEEQFRFGLVEVTTGAGTSVVLAGGAMLIVAAVLSGVSRRTRATSTGGRREGC
jgi:hypothetical protein